MTAARIIRVRFDKSWAAQESRGLLAPDPRGRTLCRVLVTYPQVRHIVTDRLSFDAATDTRTLDTVARFLQRQHWLVESLSVE